MFGIGRKFFVFFLLILINQKEILSNSKFPVININPLNRVTIYFDKFPKDFQSYLNSTKTLISIIVYNIETNIILDSVVSEGIISKVLLKKISNHIEINIYLKSPRGYTIAPIEFSNSLMVEVFEWNALNHDEENYRMGLLSLTGNLAVARKYFESAFNGNIANAGFFLGYLYLKANEIEKAKEVFEKAEILGCNIPDLFFALAQIFDILKDQTKADAYRTKYFKHQGIAKYKPIEIDSALKDSIFKEVTELLPLEKGEQALEITSRQDTFNKQQPIIISEQEISSKQDRFTIFEKVLIFLGVSIVLLSILLTSLYFKWKREKKLRDIKKKFENELLKQKYTTSSALAARLYKKTETESKANTETTGSKEPTVNSFNPEVKELAEKIISSKKQDDKEKSSTQTMINKQTPSISKSKFPIRIEKAMQLQKEQMELIKQKFGKLELSDIPTNKEKLEELAKNLGINKSSLLAKKNIEAMEKNKDLYNKLYKKFFKKSNE